MWSTPMKLSYLLCVIVLFQVGCLCWLHANHSQFLPNNADDIVIKYSTDFDPPHQLFTPPAVTITMTTCNRLHLTQESLRTFYQFNSDANIQSFKVTTDCYDPIFVEKIGNEFPNIQLIRPTTNAKNPNQRMMDNMQLLFTHVLQEGTQFWVHLEDDWNFVKNSFITDGMKVINEQADKNSHIWMVIGREVNSMGSQKGRVSWQNTTDENNIAFGMLNILSGWHNKWG